MSAEHGLGFNKAQYIYHSKSREAVLWMKRLKQLFDPKVSVAKKYIRITSHPASNLYINC